jgi:hypothetical protein
LRWWLNDLASFEKFRITLAKQTLSRELRAMGYQTLGAATPPCSSRRCDQGF